MSDNTQGASAFTQPIEPFQEENIVEVLGGIPGQSVCRSRLHGTGSSCHVNHPLPFPQNICVNNMCPSNVIWHFSDTFGWTSCSLLSRGEGTLGACGQKTVEYLWPCLSFDP